MPPGTTNTTTSDPHTTIPFENFGWFIVVWPIIVTIVFFSVMAIIAYKAVHSRRFSGLVVEHFREHFQRVEIVDEDDDGNGNDGPGGDADNQDEGGDVVGNNIKHNDKDETEDSKHGDLEDTPGGFPNECASGELNSAFEASPSSLGDLVKAPGPRRPGDTDGGDGVDVETHGGAAGGDTSTEEAIPLQPYSPNASVSSLGLRDIMFLEDDSIEV